VPPVAEPAGLLGMLQFTKDDVMYGIELAVHDAARPRRAVERDLIPGDAETLPGNRTHAANILRHLDSDAAQQAERICRRRIAIPRPAPVNISGVAAAG